MADLIFPNYAQSFMGGLQAGGQIQDLRRQNEARSTLAKYAPDIMGGNPAAQKAAVSAIAQVDPEMAFKLQGQLSQMNDAQLEHAQNQTKILAGVGQWLKGVPPEQRKQALAQQAPRLLASGIPQAQIDSFDPSDQSIDGLVSQATTVADQIKQAQDKRDFAYKQGTDDRSFQAGRSDHADTVRHQNFEEGISSATLAESRSQHQYERNKPVALQPGGTLIDPNTGRQVANGGPKPMTNDQSNSASFADRAAMANKTLSQVEQGAGTSVVQRGLNAVPGGNFMVSPQFQQFDQAKRDFVNAVLRKESGAAISESEFNNAEKQYFAQPGDSPQVITQKRQNRALVIDGLARGAGAGYHLASPQAPTGSGGHSRVINFNDLPE